MNRGSARTRTLTAALISALISGAVLAACGGGQDAPTPAPTATPSVTAAPAGEWRELAASPLSPRRQAVAVWTGTEVLVFGGEPVACAGAECAQRPAGADTDAAAYDPAADRWRQVAPVPELVLGAAAVLAGRTVYTFSNAGDEPSFLAYDLDRDRWRRLPVPPKRIAFPRLTATRDGRVVATLLDHKERGDRDWVFDPAGEGWTALPADPLGIADNRFILSVDDGALVLVGVKRGANPDVVAPIYAAARLGPGEDEWTALPNSSVTVDVQVWWAVGSTVVSPLGGRGRPGADGAPAETYPYGGILDLAVGQWAPLPEPVPRHPRATTGDPLLWAQAGGRETVVSGANVLHVPTGRWYRLAPPSDLRDLVEPTVTWAGDRLFVWAAIEAPGASADAPLRTTGWTWRAAGLP